jgi:hypothetical protein
MVDYLRVYLLRNKSSWIKDILDRVYQVSLNHKSLKELQTYCEEIIKQDPELIFISNLFPTLERELLLKLIKREDISLSEVEIWSCLIEWVREQKYKTYY